MSLQIDNDLRTITIPEDVTFLGVAGDKNVRVLEFTMLSAYGNIDLSGYDIVINYKNIERGRMRKSEGSYAIAGAAALDGTITFAWQIGAETCKYHGDTWFSVSLINGGSNIFNTQWVSLPVLQKQMCQHPAENEAGNETIVIDMGNVTLSVNEENLIIAGGA